MRAIGVRRFLEKKFDCFAFDGKFLDSFAEPEKNFRMLIYGPSGSGKTEFCMQLAKYLCGFTRVYYNSYEQGISKSLQDSLRRNNMEEVAGKIIFGDRENVKEMTDRLKKRNSAKVVFIDSRDDMGLTAHQYSKLIHQFPKKAFIITAWEHGGKPKGHHGKAIEYLADIKVQVSEFRTKHRCRFGGNEPFVIWDKPKKKVPQIGLFEQR